MSTIRFVVRHLMSAIILSGVLFPHLSSAAEPLQLRVDTLTVPPSTQPLIHVVARNSGTAVLHGSVSLAGPEGWRLTPSSRPLAIEPGHAVPVPFLIEQGRNVEANRYAFTVTAVRNGVATVSRHETFVASAPYFKPIIDGHADDWKDAIPVNFTVAGKRTTVSGYWNRRQLSLMVAVQEDKLTEYAGDASAAPFDAVQFQIAATEPAADAKPPAKAGRYEFLLASAASAGRCFLLAEPTTDAAVLSQSRMLSPLAFDKAEVAVRREADVTYYECAIPFRTLAGHIEPAEGREFFLAVLIHDPDGTGLRDLGAAVGLWPTEQDEQGWARWPGAVWPDKPPRNGQVRWGFCTSKY